jgi:uncharacterized protein YigA (DUF484 family)
MTTPAGKPNKANDLDADSVRAYLADRPTFLADNPDLIAVLAPPDARRGDGVVDMQRFMIERLQARLQASADERAELIAATRSNMMSQVRIHAAALALIEARTFEHLIEVVATDLANMLEVDVVTLCVENSERIGITGTEGVRLLAAGKVDEILGGERDIVLRTESRPDRNVFGSAAGLVKSASLMRLRISAGGPIALLAMGSRDADRFHPGQGTELLGFLGAVLARTIRSWLDLPPN